MSSDGFWQVFADTGDPLCWLMTREGAGNSAGAADEGEPAKNNDTSDGAEPSE